MATTIQISNKLKELLNGLKLYEKETYEEVILNLVEDSMELSSESKKMIEQSEKEINSGKYSTLSEFERELDI